MTQIYYKNLKSFVCREQTWENFYSSMMIDLAQNYIAKTAMCAQQFSANYDFKSVTHVTQICANVLPHLLTHSLHPSLINLVIMAT